MIDEMLNDAIVKSGNNILSDAMEAMVQMLQGDAVSKTILDFKLMM